MRAALPIALPIALLLAPLLVGAAAPLPKGRNGIVTTTGPLAGLRLRDRRVEDVYRVIENKAGTLSDAIVERVTATGLRRGFARIGADSHDIVFRRVAGTMTIVQREPHLPVGIGIEGKARDILVEDAVMRGFQMTGEPRTYWNGDGYSAERGNRGLVFRRAASWDNSDAGFDLKSTETRLEDTVAGGNGRNYRFWSAISTGTITSISPVKRGGTMSSAHIWVSGKRNPSIVVERLVVRSTNTAPIWRVEDGPADIRVDACDIDVVAGTSWAEAGDKRMRWTLGPTCQAAKDRLRRRR